MNRGAVFALAVVALGLGGYILLFERDSLTSGERAQRAGRVLPELVRPKIDRLELQRQGVTTVLVRSKDEEGTWNDWRMLEPYQDAADEDAIDAVLGELEWLDARRMFESITDEDRALFGLDKPRHRVTFTAGGERHVLVLGKQDVHGDSVYARTDNPDTAYAVPRTVAEALSHPPGHFRTKQFMGDITIAWAREVTLADDRGSRLLTRPLERWWVEGDTRTFGDGKRIQDMLRAFDDLRATRYLEKDEGGKLAATLQKPTLSVVVKLIPDTEREDQKPRALALSVGGPCADHEGERVARQGADGPLVCVREDDLAPFEQGLGAYRQGSLWSVASTSEIEAFALAAGAQRVALKRDGEKWVPEGKGDFGVDRETVELWLADLDKALVRRFESEAGFKARGSLWLRDAEGKEQTIEVGGLAADGTVYLKRGDEGVLAAYPLYVADLLTPEPGRFASLALWDLKPSDVVGIDARAGEVRRTLLRETLWRPGPGQPPVADEVAVRDEVRALAKLRALRFVAAKSRPDLGLARPTSELTVRTAAREGQSGGVYRLRIGASTDEGAYAQVDDGPVYELEATSVAVVTRLAKGVPMAAPAPAAAAGGARDDGDDGLDHGDDEDLGHQRH